MTPPLDPKQCERGMYRRDEIDYAAIPAINQSTLKHMGKSPLHYQHARTSTRKATVPMRLGTVAHTAVLEPERLARDYAVYVPEDGKKDVFKGQHYESCLAMAQRSGRTLIKQAEYDAAVRIQRAVHANRLAQRYLARIIAEPILVWRDEETGLLCKARLDGVSLSVPDVMTELKTARDVAHWAFAGAFGKLGYHIQTAFYADGYKAVTGRELYGKCIAIENTEPHDSIVYDLAEVVDAGREDYRKLMTRLAECLKTGVWPGQSPDSEVTLQLPKWLTDDDGESAPLADLGLEGWEVDA